MTRRSARSTAGTASAKLDKTPRTKAGLKNSKNSKNKPNKRATLRDYSSDSPEEVEGTEDEGEAYVQDEEEPSDVESINSDNLDDDLPPNKSQRRKRGSTSSAKSSPKKKSTPRKKRKKVDEDEDAQSEFELDEGQEIVGKVIQAPKTGRGRFVMTVLV